MPNVVENAADRRQLETVGNRKSLRIRFELIKQFSNVLSLNKLAGSIECNAHEKWYRVCEAIANVNFVSKFETRKMIDKNRFEFSASKGHPCEIDSALEALSLALSNLESKSSSETS